MCIPFVLIAAGVGQFSFNFAVRGGDLMGDGCQVKCVSEIRIE